jgi:hypothetical protein
MRFFLTFVALKQPKMKQKFTLLFALTICILGANAQTIQLNQGFTSTFNPAANGWIVQNNSVPTGTTTWLQGSSNIFTAQVGGQSDYYACSYTSQGSTSGGISNFLITPTLSLANGATFKFATRTVATPSFPDRMQVLMSQGTGTGAIGSGTAAVGTFNTLCFDINPSLTTTGYPTGWTVYTYTVTGISGVQPGRFAFRYFVSDGGPNGSNSDFIGIDEVVFTTARKDV